MNNLYDELLLLKSAAEAIPSPEKVVDILNLLAKGPTYEQLFFDKLNDPAWLPVLDQYGYFSNLPEGKKTDSGALMYPYHLPLFGLARLAHAAPHAVTSILAKLDIPDSPTVSDQVLRCIASIIEPSCIPILHSLLVKLGEKSSRSSWVWIHELINNWVNIKAFNDVLIVTNSYLQASVGTSVDNSPLRDAWSIQQLEKISLEKLTPAFPLQIATIAFNALSRFEKVERNLNATDKTSKELEIETYFGENTSPAYWVEDFNSAPRYHDFEGTLAHRLYLAAEEIYKKANIQEIDLLDQLLCSNSWMLFQRLRWKLYANFPDLNSARARKVVVERIPYLNHFEFEFCHELAEMIQVHSNKFGKAFLSNQEVEQIFDIVMSGPIEKFNDTSDDHFKNVFRRKQLWPILSILRNEQLAVYNTLTSVSSEISLNSYKPFRSGGGEARFIESAPPSEAENLAEKSDSELWNILNFWQPPQRDYPNTKWWVKENYGALAKKFAEIIELNPKRFLPTTKWWENLKRPEPLFETLNRAADRIKKKQQDKQDVFTDDDWANWLGVAKWIVLQSSISGANQTENEQKKTEYRTDWYWSTMVVSNFLTAAIQSPSAGLNTHQTDLEQLFTTLVEKQDVRLQGNANDKFDDWLSIAINSVRGNAIEAIISLALSQKNAKKEIQPWIFELICSRLTVKDESPAIFALLGSKLRLLVHLFKEKLRKKSDLLLPSDRPHHQGAVITSHFRYDAPWAEVVDVFPDLLDKALSIMEQAQKEGKDENSRQRPRDFASQLGVHIAFYYWNSAFKNDEEGKSKLDRFFKMARGETRAIVINEIGRIFEKAPEKKDPESEIRFKKVMQLWERRFNQISAGLDADGLSLEEVQGELGQFLDWLNSECFPFEWRLSYAMSAINHLKKAPDVFRLLETLDIWNDKYPDRLNGSLEILKAFLERPSDQLRWSIQTRKIEPLLTRGLSSDIAQIKSKAMECRDLLLKLGYFELLNLQGIKTKA